MLRCFESEASSFVKTKNIVKHALQFFKFFGSFSGILVGCPVECMRLLLSRREAWELEQLQRRRNCDHYSNSDTSAGCICRVVGSLLDLCTASEERGAKRKADALRVLEIIDADALCWSVPALFKPFAEQRPASTSSTLLGHLLAPGAFWQPPPVPRRTFFGNMVQWPKTEPRSGRCFCLSMQRRLIDFLQIRKAYFVDAKRKNAETLGRKNPVPKVVDQAIERKQAPSNPQC